MVDTVEILGYDIYKGSIEDIVPERVGRPMLVTTLNAHAYVVADKDVEFREALRGSDVLLPDGSGIVIASKILNTEAIDKIAMYECFLFQLERLEKEGGSCFFLGAAPQTLEAIKARLNREYPHIRVGTYSPPYKSAFSDQESEEMIEAVNAFEPEVLFVGMTAPKQEKWAYRFRDRLQVKMILAVGANFDFFAGTVSRPPVIFIKLHLEWLGRFLNEPRRMWRRVFVSLPLFVVEVFAVRFGFRKI